MSRTLQLQGFIEKVKGLLDPAAREQFRELEQWMLDRALRECGLEEYPAVSGDPSGERASDDMLCQVCGKDYLTHPMDWRLIGYGDVPFLNILCDGRRVKL